MGSDESGSQSTEESPPPPSDNQSGSPPPADGSSAQPPPNSDNNQQSTQTPPSVDQSSQPPPSGDQSSQQPPPDQSSNSDNNQNTDNNQSSNSDNNQNSDNNNQSSNSDNNQNSDNGNQSSNSKNNQNSDNDNQSSSNSSNDRGNQNQNQDHSSSSGGSSGSSKKGSSSSSGNNELEGDSEYSDRKQSGSKKSSKSDQGDKHNDSTDSIVGVAAGAALLLAVILLMIACCVTKKNKKKRNQYMSARPDDDYYNRNASPNMPAQPGDHFVNIPPPPGNKPWMSTPPPPPPNQVSSNMSSGPFSGPYGPPVPPPHPSVALGFNQSTFTYEELHAATGGFSQDNLLGQGGFGYVHKGVLSTGKEVAVKSLKATSGQGDREFQAEVEIISRVHHRHLVSLVGYCISGEQKLLVYEYVPNKTLEYHLYGKDTPVMDWPTRLKIAIGSAKGLAYLHEDCHPRIIHRDIKAANILIETNFDAKVADFGLAKLNQDNNTHVSTRVMGTFGYLAPEYASSGKLTEKSDVFSFGVMLLELITGRPPVDQTGRFEDSLVDWARPLCGRALDTGDCGELVDPRLEDVYNKQEMSCMIASAVASVRHSARRRPKMSEIVRTMEGDVSLDTLNESLKSAGQRSTVFSSDSSEYDSYSSDMKKFKKLALGTENFANSDQYGRSTGEFGHSGTSSSDSR